MKKILTIAMLLIAAFSFSSCDSNTPSDAVKNAFEYQQKGDFKNYCELISSAEKPKVDESNRKHYYKEYSGEYYKRTILSLCEPISDLDVVSEEIDHSDSNSAVVTVRYKYDGEEQERTIYVKKCADGKWRILFNRGDVKGFLQW